MTPKQHYIKEWHNHNLPPTSFVTCDNATILLRTYFLQHLINKIGPAQINLFIN